MSDKQFINFSICQLVYQLACLGIEQSASRLLQGASCLIFSNTNDLPRLNTPFLAVPIAWKASLAQYAARIHWESDGKMKVKIHDYVDCSLPMLQRMFDKREEKG